MPINLSFGFHSLKIRDLFGTLLLFFGAHRSFLAMLRRKKEAISSKISADFEESEPKTQIIIVTGIGTDVGKTIVSAILVQTLEADYWKPIQCGESDAARVQELVRSPKSTFHPEAYLLQHPLSPHYAAKLEGKTIETGRIQLPSCSRTLIIETAGGIYVPLNDQELLIDVFKKWDALWIVVSALYLGCINHTLLTIEALKREGCSILGLIFNGEEPVVEEAILRFSHLPCLGKLKREENLSPETIQRYANLWKIPLSKRIKKAYGIPSPRC